MPDNNSCRPSRRRGAARRVLLGGGVTSAALVVSAAAALPALANNGNPHAAAHPTHGNSTAAAKHQHGKEHHNAGASNSHGQRASNKPTRPAHAHPAYHQGSTGHATKSHETNSHAAHTNPAHTNMTAAGHNPPGNNGTVFIHQTADDSHPHNQPHVSCLFYVALFNFDSNQALTAGLTGQAPTGAGTPVDVNGQPMLSTTAPDNGATGAGHGYDGDFDSLAFSSSNMDLSALGAPAMQGYHLRLTIGTGQGGGRKTKVFWFTPCSPDTPAGTSGGAAGSTTSHTATRIAHRAGTKAPSGSAIGPRGNLSFKPAASRGGTEVLGLHFRRGASAATPEGGSATSPTAVSASSLPFTGADIAGMTAAGLLALVGGAGLVRLGRRRRVRSSDI